MTFLKALQKRQTNISKSSTTTFPVAVSGMWKYLPEFILFSVCTVPALFLSSRALQEPWTLFRVARANLSLQLGQVATYATEAAGYRAEHIGGEVVQTALIRATGLPLESIGVLPMGALLLAITYYGLTYAISGSRLTSGFLALFTSFYYPRLYSQYGTQTYVWTNILFLNFLLVLFLWIHRRTLVLSILLIIIFITTFLHYHTTPVWIIISLAVSVLGLTIRKKANLPLPNGVSWALPLFCVVLYLQFDTVLYGNGLVRLKNDAVNELFLQSIINRMITPFLARSPENLDPFTVIPINPRIATWSTLTVLLILTIPAGLWILQQLLKVTTSRKISSAVHHPHSIFAWVVVFTALGHALLYLFYGALSLRVIPLAFPLLIPIIRKSWQRDRRVEYLWSGALALCAMIGFSSFAPTFLPDVTASETGIAVNLIPEESYILSEPNVYGSLLIKASEDGHILNYLWPTPDLYRSLVGQTEIEEGAFDYFVADLSGKPVTAIAWEALAPWIEHLPQIAENKWLNKTYDNGHIQLFQAWSAPISTFHYLPRSPESEGRLWTDSLILFLGIGRLFFLPGAIFLLLMQQKGGLLFQSPFAFGGLSVGISLCFVTLIGYFVNFSPLGLEWQVGMVVMASFILLLVFWLFPHATDNQSMSSIWRYGLVLAAVLFLWSALAATTSENRIAANSEYTELFLTQNNTTNEVEINVINQLKHTETFTVIVVYDGDNTVIIDDAIELAPNGYWQHSVNREAGQNGSVHFILQVDGVDSGSVWLHGEQ